MKKGILSKLMLALFVALTGISVTACGEDNDEPKVEDKFSTEYTFEVEFTADFLKIANVKAYILYPESSITEEVVTKTKNTWIIKGSSIPDKAGVLLVFTAKTGDFSGDYELGYKVNQTVTCFKNALMANIKRVFNNKC